jgi:hypothetical protein
MPQNLRIAATAAFILMSVLGAVAQDYDIDWYTVDGGGEMSSAGGSYELAGTIGQADAGQMTGGSYTLNGGFWAVQTCPMLPSDFDADCDVDLDDFTILEASMNGPNQTPGDPLTDLDGDNDCDVNDFSILAAQFTGQL